MKDIVIYRISLSCGSGLRGIDAVDSALTSPDLTRDPVNIGD